MTTSQNTSFIRQMPDKRLDLFYEAHADRVFRLCLRLTGNCHSEAEDLAQEVLVAALQSLPALRRTCADHHLALHNSRSHVPQTRVEPGAAHAFAQRARPADRSGRLRAGDKEHLLHLSITAALADLPVPLREAFVLVKAEGFTHKEAARILDLPQGTVQARVHEAARRLRLVLAEKE